MAYGNGTQYDKNSTLIFFSPTNKDSNKQKVDPHFTIAKIVNGKIEKQAETATQVIGSLVKIDVKDREINKVVNKEAKLYLKDASANELYVVSLSFRLDSRSLFNGLINLQTNDPITVSIYTNKKGYSSYSLKQNNVRVDWKYELEELPRPVSVPFKGKIMNDYSIVDDFFAKELNELSVRLFGKEIEGYETPQSAEPALAAASSEVKSEDVPF